MKFVNPKNDISIKEKRGGREFKEFLLSWAKQTIVLITCPSKQEIEKLNWV